MAGRPKKRRSKVSGFLHAELPRYDLAAFANVDLHHDKVASTLGSAIGGWVPELVYRFSIHPTLGLNVDWAIMIDAYRAEDGARGDRRRVERIDICHSEVHVHRFRISDDPGDDQGERTPVISLYAGDEATVNRQWDLQMEALSREWPDRMRRWLDA